MSYIWTCWRTRAGERARCRVDKPWPVDPKAWKAECPSGDTLVVFKYRACHDRCRRFSSHLRFASIAAAAAGMLRIGARCRGGDDASFHGGVRGGTCSARPCDLAVPVPVYGAGRQTARPAQAGSGHDPCCRGRSCQTSARTSPHRRRQVVRRSDDVAGSGRSSPSGRPWTRVPWISVAPGGTSIAGSRQASLRCSNSHAVPAGDTRHACHARSA